MLLIQSNLRNPQFVVETTIKQGIQILDITEKRTGFNIEIQQLAFSLDNFLELFANAEPNWRAQVIDVMKNHDPKAPGHQLTVGLIVDILKG